MSKWEAVIVAALIGAFVSLATSWASNRISSRKRGDEMFNNALNYLGGGSQRRNLGIATVSMYWRDFPEHKAILNEMLIGAAIYLLTGSKQEDSSHELYNLNRIMQLINITSVPTNSDSYGELISVIDDRINSENDKPKKGLWVDKKMLKGWREKMSS